MLTSKRANQRLAIFMLAAVVVISGCVGQPPGGITTGPGVIIKDFLPDFDRVESGEKVRLQVKIENTGGTPAKNTVLQLAGINAREWGTSEEQRLGDLLPVDLETNTPGGIVTKTFDLRAPQLPQGIEHQFEPVAKVGYDYKTTAVKGVMLVDIDELRAMKQRGQTPAVRSVQSSGGPLSIDVKTGDVIKTGEGRDSVQLFLSITNTQWSSGGTVTSAGRGGNFDFPVSVKISSTGVSVGSCTFTSGSGSSGTIDLWQGKDGQVTCELDISGRGPTFREETLITMELDYRYLIEKSTRVTVIGTARGR